MRLLIVDDDILIRDGLKMIFELEEDMEVVGVAANGKEAFEQCEASPPDIVLMDIRMPEFDGIYGTKLIKESFPAIKVLMLTTFLDEEYIKNALKNGAEGYLLKNQAADTIIESIRSLNKGSFVCEKGVIDVLKELLYEQATSPNEKNLNGLSSREAEILKLISEGFNNQEIAEQLFIGSGTVRNYISGLLGKLELRDRTQLAIYYLKS